MRSSWRSVPDRRKAGSHPWWHRWLALPIGRVIVAVWLRLFVRTRTEYVERIPATGGLLIVANHISDLDPILVQFLCPRPIHFMAKSELFEMRAVGTILRIYGAFPVRRGEPDTASLRYALALLKAGEVVCVFPEGRLSETGDLIDLQPGSALLARQAGVPVLPCGVIGSNVAMPYGTTRLRRTSTPVVVRWGEPYAIDRRADNDAVLQDMAERLRSLSR